MSPDDFEAQKARVRDLFDCWRNVLGLDEWSIDLAYHDAPYIDGDGEVRSKALGCAEVEWKYRRATLYFRLDLTPAEDDDDLEYCLVHEAMHVLLNGMRPVLDAANGIATEYRRMFEEHTRPRSRAPSSVPARWRSLMADALPFPKHPTHFRRRGEYLAWFMATYPNASETAYVMAAGSPELYVKELEAHRAG